MSKIGTLLGRLEEQAIRIHELTQEREREREEVADLLQRREVVARSVEAIDHYGELRRVIMDASTLFARADLTDADKVKSIQGLMQQVTNRDWFGRTPQKPVATPRRRKAPAARSPAAEEDDPDTEEDAREFARDF